MRDTNSIQALATFTKRQGKNGVRWRALVRRRGVVACNTFPTKLQAQEWAAGVERDAMAGEYRARSKESLGEAIKRFLKDVAIHRRGARWEKLRLAAFQEREKRLCALPLSSLDVSALEGWRDDRLASVSASTVRREIALLGAVLSQAVRWGLIRANPLKDVKKPAAPAARRRGVSVAEIEAITLALGDAGAGGQIAAAFLLSLETGMRCGEILGLTWDHVHLDERYVVLPKTKNGDSRQVPLSTKAVDILNSIPKSVVIAEPAAVCSTVTAGHMSGHDESALPVANITGSAVGPLAGLPASKQKVFTVTGPTLDVLFRRARDAAVRDCPSVHDLHFHDCRGQAIRNFVAKGLSAPEICSIVGHRDLKSMMSYFRHSASEIAKKLD